MCILDKKIILAKIIAAKPGNVNDAFETYMKRRLS